MPILLNLVLIIALLIGSPVEFFCPLHKGSYAEGFGGFMRRLNSLTRKLARIGVDVCIVKHSRCDYTAFWWTCSDRSEFRRDLHSVKECESFLLSLFR